MVKELNINNTKALEKLRSKATIESPVSYGSAIILLLLIIGSITELLQRRRSTERTPVSVPETQEKPTHSGPVLYYVATEDSRV
ncbi:hypothetical protein M5D96_010819 [Drosophila gunungcola]|uniref:Uncharacterized protein n=1 Tax=Drosophila gunungcola TaxID=103775 RepID=A0A9Q0BL17_9MUSC|nr:hypothetical protein M5D96_010819 [Drosophila gunungcola]